MNDIISASHWGLKNHPGHSTPKGFSPHHLWINSSLEADLRCQYPGEYEYDVTADSGPIA